ncbi:hypothetical protein SDC9_175442 [bioreactor metagenome]|uniref:Uncharacterized protein n=1 Tax=bioreactor metagenome TaxID=1076179 RepID=A0A645GM66_9ZZZZ
MPNITVAIIRPATQYSLGPNIFITSGVSNIIIQVPKLKSIIYFLAIQFIFNVHLFCVCSKYQGTHALFVAFQNTDNIPAII